MKDKENKKKKKKDSYYEFDDSRKIKDSVLFKRLLVYTKKYILSFVFIIITLLISSFMVSYLNIVFGEIIDLLKATGTTFNMIMNKAYLVIFLIVGGFGITLVRDYWLCKIGQKILFDMRLDIFNHIEHLSLKELDKTPVGTFVTRVCNDTNSISQLFSQVLTRLISNVMTMIYALIFIFTLSVKLSLITLCVFPFVVVGTFLFRHLSRRQFRRITYNNSKVNAFLSENLSGMKITQIFNREETKLNEFDELNNRLKKSRAGSILIFAIFRPTIYFLYLTSVILVWYFGSKDVMAGLITEGVLYSFYLYIGTLFNPLQEIAMQFNTMQSAFASAEKIYTILDTNSSISFIDSPIKATNFKGEIEFKDVYFKYSNKEEDDWIINGMSFHVNPGETVAFVGPTGAGKTTILSLITRYYDIQKGEILIDGVNVKDYDIYDLRKNIGEMLQDVFLFSGTIKDNITLKDETITDEEIVESSKYVNAEPFILQLPNGYNEVVKERGNNYSQGQRQLLSFARTIVHKPKMIILDEATSNIDTETEVLIQDSLKKITSIGTSLIVAHRLSTIQHSDVIMFIDNGKIVESGNHSELLKKKGRYYQLYQLQYDKVDNKIN